jgi:hypothetical protein
VGDEINVAYMEVQRRNERIQAEKANERAVTP